MQKCIYCNESEINCMSYGEDDKDYSCPKCRKKFHSSLAKQYNNSSAWQKVAFRYLHFKKLLKEA